MMDGRVTTQIRHASACETVRDRQGHVLGTVERQGTLLVLKDRRGHLLGSYDGAVTRNRQGRLVGYGNLLGTFLRAR